MNYAGTFRTSALLLAACLLASPDLAASPSPQVSAKAPSTLRASIWRTLEGLFPALSAALADSGPDGTNGDPNGQSPAPGEPDRGAGMDPWG
jgi:hypothetical protein